MHRPWIHTNYIINIFNEQTQMMQKLSWKKNHGNKYQKFKGLGIIGMPKQFV